MMDVLLGTRNYTITLEWVPSPLTHTPLPLKKKKKKIMHFLDSNKNLKSVEAIWQFLWQLSAFSEFNLERLDSFVGDLC